MSGIKQHPIRFSVTDGAGLRAATWNLRPLASAHGQEIYLNCREIGGTIHTSFHASGEWHTTFSPEGFRKLHGEIPPPGTRRRIEEWKRPVEIQPGITVGSSDTVRTPSRAKGRAFAQELRLAWDEEPLREKIMENLKSLDLNPAADQSAARHTASRASSKSLPPRP